MLNILERKRDVEQSPRNQKLCSLPIDCICANPYQPRKVFREEAIDELARSIRMYGLLQPISVRRVGREEYELVAGERRLRAARRAGLTEIPAIITNLYDRESALLALIENLQRENLNYFEEAEGYDSLLRDHAMTQEELARKVGKNQSTIANKLRLLRLSPKVRQALSEAHLSERHARALLRIVDEEKQLEVIQKVREKHLSVQQTEELVQKMIQVVHEVPAKNGSVLRIYRDYRLFLNTIKTAVKQMNGAGFSASYATKEVGDTMEICVTISKT